MTVTSNNRRTRLLPKIIFGQLVVGVIMGLLACSILFFAEGYRFNWKNFKIVKTGIVNLVSYPKDSDVYIDGRLVSKKTPFSMNLKPGSYSTEITKEGYKSWHMNFKIEEQLVTNYKNITLFFNEPKISDLRDQRKIDLLMTPNDVLAQPKNGLSYNDYEIWYNNKLITRFSSVLLRVQMYASDSGHILYQVGDEIHIIETSGFNDYLLVKLNQASPAQFITNDNGDELYYLDNGQYKTAIIR